MPELPDVEATRRYLEHLIGTWSAAFPDHSFAEQQVVLTVPASFDASARELTHEHVSNGAATPNGKKCCPYSYMVMPRSRRRASSLRHFKCRRPMVSEPAARFISSLTIRSDLRRVGRQTRVRRTTAATLRR